MMELLDPARISVVMDNVWADMNAPGFWLGVAQITWIDLLLAGDNAVVIALACRNLPERQRFWGLVLGAGVAVLLRLMFALVAANLMALPYVKLVGGVALLFVALKLLWPEEENDKQVKASERLWEAVAVITIADVVMSLDNVLAIAAASKGEPLLLIFGVAASIPLILAGSKMLMWVFDRLPALIWAGAALLGWIAGDVIADDFVVRELLARRYGHVTHEAFEIAGAVLVLAIGVILQRLRQKPDSA